MSAGDNTKDNRWRPGFASSERRVREELEEPAEHHVFRRELAFVPSQRTPKFEAHDAQTRALIAQHALREQLRHGHSVGQRVETWRWLDAMQGPREKQAYLEPLFTQVRRDPVEHEDTLLFLMIVCEPIRRSVHKQYRHVRGAGGPIVAQGAHDRTQARFLRQIEAETLQDVTRKAVLEAIYLVPAPFPRAIFPWMREVVAHHALRDLKQELLDDTTPMSAKEAEWVQAAIAGLEDAEAPAMREPGGVGRWRSAVDLRGLYSAVDEFYDLGLVRSACEQAIGRLPRRQAEVIDGLFFRGRTANEMAIQRKVARSTIDNQKLQATRRMERDDSFFGALHDLGILCDRARAEEIRARYPDGRVPDGRRIVHIDEAA